MKAKLISLLMGSVMLAGLIPAIHAENLTGLASNCERVITIKDDQFLDGLRRNPGAAREIADLLSQCHLKMVCNLFNDKTQCATKLAMREFISTYFKMAPSDTNTNPIISFQGSAPPANPMIADAEPTTSPVNNTNNSLTTPVTPIAPNDVNTTDNKPEPEQEIHWF